MITRLRSSTAGVVAAVAIVIAAVAVVGNYHPTSPAPQRMTDANRGAAAQVLATGSGTSESKFVPISPCRVVDTRVHSSSFTVGQTRSYFVNASAAAIEAQGGDATGCTVPSGITAVAATIKAVSPTGSGFVRAWPNGASEPTTSVLNFAKTTIGDSSVLKVDTAAAKDFSVRVYGHRTHIVVDVQGYYVAPISAWVNSVGTLDQNWSSRAVTASRIPGFPVGNYEVVFDRNVVNCIYQATGYGTPATIITQPRSGNPNAVFVQTTSASTGAALDNSFFLTVTC
ncbi:MAG: hypothetical protein NTX33_15075 [Propionibacteriales bacterium]|nr:hypothetical protein [Propionibacteriales bacterium]